MQLNDKEKKELAVLENTNVQYSTPASGFPFNYLQKWQRKKRLEKLRNKLNS